MDASLTAAHFLDIIARRHAGDRAYRPSHEGVPTSEAQLDHASCLPPPATVVGRVSELLGHVPTDEVGDAADFALAKDMLLTSADRALEKARREGPTACYTPTEVGAFEALVKVDGSRPSLMLRNGAVSHDHPFLGSWRDDVQAFGDVIAKVSASVGRIEPERGSADRYWGTGFAIDGSRGLLLTCRHVLEKMRHELRPSVARDGRLNFASGAYVDFAGEVGLIRRERLRVTSGRLVGEALLADGHPVIDAAVLRIEPLGGQDGDEPTHPPPGLLITDDPAGPLGQVHSIVLVGFPGPVPPRGARERAADGIDWRWVTDELLGGRKGVKRLAPGLVHQPMMGGGSEADRHCFGHDATTLSGSSGSPVIVWRDRGSPVCGLHLSGRTLAGNQAHAMCAIKAEYDAAMAAI